MIKIKVPASSANIGGGFDCLGIALSIYNEIHVRESNKFKIVTEDRVPRSTKNLIYKSIVSVFEYILSSGKKLDTRLMSMYIQDKQRPLPIYIKQINNIPKTSGMGSSAACVVGGVLAGNYLLGNPMCQQEIINLITEIEGHPDNVMPAYLGGVVASCVSESGEVSYIRENPHGEVGLIVFTPDFPLETAKSRRVLPNNYKIKDVVYSMSRAVMTFHAIVNNPNMLACVVGDRLHEPYRYPLIPGHECIAALSKDCGAHAVYLSGAGPSIAAFIGEDFDLERIKSELPSGWRYTLTRDNFSGASVEYCEDK